MTICCTYGMHKEPYHGALWRNTRSVLINTEPCPVNLNNLKFWNYYYAQAAVKALAWSPFQRNLLALGGGTRDCNLCMWNTSTGDLLSSINTESQITGIIWHFCVNAFMHATLLCYRNSVVQATSRGKSPESWYIINRWRMNVDQHTWVYWTTINKSCRLGLSKYVKNRRVACTSQIA